MNYKDVVNRIQEIVEDHKMLVDFGYGQVSDLKTRSTGTEGEPDGADYPYLFLNPTQHVRTQQQITYNFNMIVMDMAREEEAHEYQNFLNIQSDCIQYIDDVVARLYYYYKDKPEVSMDLNYTPFYERFQDDLAGATATLSIVVPNSINECIAPFNPDIIPALPIIYQIEQTVDNPLYKIQNYQGPLLDANATIIDTQYLTESGGGLDTTILQDGTYRFTYTTTSSNLIDQADITAARVLDPTVWTEPDGKMYLQSGFFFGQTLVLWNELDIITTRSIGEVYTQTHTFDISLPADRYQFQFRGYPTPANLENVAICTNTQYQIELVNLDPYTPPAPDPILPIADFTSNITTVEAGSSVQFTDTSTVPAGGPAITDWLWTFVGGTPMTSTLQNPSIQYDTIGSYQVVLQVTNADGSDSRSTTNYITVEAVPTGTLVLDTFTTGNQTIQPDASQSPVSFQNTILDTYNGMALQPNIYTIGATGTWRFVMTGTGRRTSNLRGNFMDGLNLIVQQPSPESSYEANVSDWPTNPNVGVDFNFTLEWTSYQLSPANNFVGIQATDQPITEDPMLLLTGANLKAYYTA